MKYLFLIISFLICGTVFGAESSMSGDLARGGQLWANSCTRCHNLRTPNQKSVEEWEVIMTHMRIRAGYTKKDTEDVMAFLATSAK